MDRAKTLFFSNVSHEFRTPLMLMLGPVEEMLADSELSARDHPRAEVVHRNGMRLLKLVNALLDFSRIEAGRAHASYQPTDLAAFTTDLVSNFRSATEKAGLSLTVDCPPLPEPVYVDHDMWEKIVLNLVSNAFKFTLDGGISVSFGVEKGPAGQLAVMRVKDTGVGIPADELPRLFERFHRVEGARGRSIEGSGIGLALVQELVKLHGGSIKVTSEEGYAPNSPSAFHLAPLISPRSPFTPIAGRPPPRSMPMLMSRKRCAGCRTRRQERDACTRGRFRWRPASRNAGSRQNPARRRQRRCARLRAPAARRPPRHHRRRRWRGGAQTPKSSRPDLVLTDIMMPRVDGLRLIREIREHAEWRDLPIIVLSARAGAEDSVVGLAAGADDYLVKPFASRELIARVDGALKRAGLRRQMNEALRQSQARFRNMADHAPIMIWTTDPSGACTYLSRSWSEFTGQAVETGLGRGWLDVIHPDDREATAKTFFDSNRLHKAFNLETRFRTKAGDYRCVMGAAVPWLGTNDEFLGYIGSVIDITDRRLVEETQRRLNEILETKILEAVKKRELAEEKLLRAQKMEAVGKLTGGIAHDFNNLLQVIGGNLQLLQKDMAGNDKAEQRLRNAINGVSRGAKLASQLLAFGRRQPLAPKAVNLGRLVRGLDEILRRTLGEEIEIETVIAAGLWNTMVDPTHVENAILNLAINARDAMAGAGKLTIEVGNACLDDDYALEYEITAGQFVMLAVSDTGSGMRPEVMEQAFEPFFTTKPEGQGTGLGLSMVYGFVKQSGGHIKIYSEIGQGTTIRMYLPRIRQEEDRPVGSKHRAVAGGSETILVVEDDDDVSATVVEMLTDLGYRVLKATDAQSAFAIIGSGVGIDLLFTDVVMPGPMRSTELAAQNAVNCLPLLRSCSRRATPITRSFTVEGSTKALNC